MAYPSEVKKYTEFLFFAPDAVEEHQYDNNGILTAISEKFVIKT